MLKLSFITDEATQEPEDFIRLARQQEIESVELRTVDGRHCSDLNAQERLSIKRKLDKAHLAVCCIDSSVFKTDLVADLSGEYAKLDRALRAACDFDAPFVRIFSFWRQVPEDPLRANRIVSAVRQAADVAAKFGKILLVENGKRTTHATGAELALLMQQIPHEALRLLWDPANSIYGGTDSDPLGRSFLLSRPYICHVHLKQVHSCLNDGTLWYGPLQGGMLEIDRFVAELVSSKYKGYVSLETHWRPDRWFAEHELDYPGGRAFSADGWDVTAQALQFLSQRVHAHLPDRL